MSDALDIACKELRAVVLAGSPQFPGGYDDIHVLVRRDGRVTIWTERREHMALVRHADVDPGGSLKLPSGVIGDFAGPR